MFSLTFALDCGDWLMPHPGHFVPQEDPVPIVREAGWLWGWSG